MFWALSVNLVPGEKVLEDSKDTKWSAYRPLYSVLLTDKRVIFRFDSLGSTLSQSFFFQDIDEVRPVKRLFIHYLEVKARNKSHLFNVPSAGHWAGRITEIKEGVPDAAPVDVSPDLGKKRALIHMLSALKDSSVISEEEYNQKIARIETLES